MSESLSPTAEKRRFVAGAWISAFAQIAGVAGTWMLLPVLTRNLGPENYGLWVLALVLVSYAFPWSEIGLGNSLMRFAPGYRSDGERHSAFRLARRTSGAISLCFSLGLALGAGWVAQHVLGGAEHAGIVRLLGILVFLEAQFAIVSTFLQAREQIARYAFLSALRSIGDLALLALLVLRTTDLVHLVLAKIGVLVILILWQWAHLRPLRLKLEKPAFSDWLELKKFIRYGFPLVPANVVWMLIMLVDRNMLEHYRSIGVVGIYSLADSIALCLLNFSRPINTVILPKFSVLLTRQSDDVTRYLEKGIKFIYLILFPALVGIILTGDILVSLLSSPAFAPAVRPLPLLCIGYFLFSLSYPVYNLVLLQRGGKTMLILSIASLTINVLLNLLLIPSLGETGAAMATCCCLLFFVIGLSAYCRVGLGGILRRLAAELGRITLAGVGMGLVVCGVRHFLPQMDVAVFPVGVVSYGILVILTGSVTPEERELLRGPLRDR